MTKCTSSTLETSVTPTPKPNNAIFAPLKYRVRAVLTCRCGESHVAMQSVDVNHHRLEEAIEKATQTACNVVSAIQKEHEEEQQ